MKQQHGFTLIELMVTLAVLTILLTVGVPNFQSFMLKNRISTASNTLIGALNLARSEAIKRGVDVKMIRLGSGAWEGGWLIQSVSTSEVIKTYPATSQLTIFTGSNYQNWVGFHPNGFPFSGGSLPNDTFKICSTRDLSSVNGRNIYVSRLGRTRSVESSCQLSLTPPTPETE